MTSNDNSRMDRVRRLLELFVREAGLPYAEVTQRLGWTPGTVSRLFGGKRELRVEQLLAILDVLGISASRFFSVAERFDALEASLVELRVAVLQELAREQRDHPKDEANGLSDSELQRRIEAALRKLFEKSAEAT
jgi:transcriptional regulator with XRE-family HTH domain